MDYVEYATGCKQDLPDSRDKPYTDIFNDDVSGKIWQEIVRIPKHESFSLEASCPDIYDQLSLGSCTANAVSAALRFAWKNSFEHIAAPYTDFSPSRIWIYYYARLIDDPASTKFDAGSSIRNAIKSLKKYGVCEESVFPYPKDGEYKVTKEERKCMKNNVEKTIEIIILPTNHPARAGPLDISKANVTTFFNFQFEYYRIRSLQDDPTLTDGSIVTAQVRWSISEGFPVIFGFNSYEGLKIGESTSWSNYQFAQYPAEHGERVGGHAVLAVGFDEKRQAFQIQNSWGETEWGEKGFGWIPYSWFENKGGVNDMWVIRPQLAPLLRDNGP